MKLLYDYAAFLMQARGGVSRVMCEVIKREMGREGVDCRVCAGFYKNHELRGISRRFPGKVQGWWLPERLAKQRLFAPVNRSLFAHFAKAFAPDICHYSFFKTPPVPSKTKTVITVHDLIGEVFSNGKTNPQVEERKKALAKADGIVCISENTKKDLLNFYAMGDKPILVAHHGNSLRNVTPKPVETGAPYFLYVGTRREVYKNFDLVLEAFKRSGWLAPFALICFGGGPFSKAELETLKRANLSERVIQRSGSDEDLAGYYRNATALIYPSKYEGFGLPPLEAMGLGCPVLASKAPPMPEINGDAALFFDPNSPEELMDAMRTLLADPKVGAGLAQKGREHEQLFCWEKTAARIHDFYARVLETPARRV